MTKDTKVVENRVGNALVPLAFTLVTALIVGVEIGMVAAHNFWGLCLTPIAFSALAWWILLRLDNTR